MKSVNESIVLLTAAYEELNGWWETDPCSLNWYQVYRQEEYKKIFNILQHFRFEEFVLQIISENLNRAVLARLQKLIENNIRIYETREKVFKGLHFFELSRIDAEHEFDIRFERLQTDLKDIQAFRYPTEQEKQMLLNETKQEIKELNNKKYKYIRDRECIMDDYYSNIYRISKSFQHIIKDYFPGKEENTESRLKTATPETSHKTTPETIEPDMIFRAKMYERFLLLEQRLIKDKYLNESLQWISTHKNSKVDKKNLVVFLTGLLDKGYFLPNKDPKIKQFFEKRYHIKIGQNFERKRRKTFADDYKIIFYDYPF